MDNITVLIPVAPMPSHPSTIVLDETIQSIRERLPTSEIILMIDHPPAWLLELSGRYNEYKQNLLWKIEREYKNVVPVVFGQHSHQSTMIKTAINMVQTPLILWSEQDTPLTGDIPFEAITNVVQTGYANSIRFHHEASVHPEHEYLMLDKAPIDVLGVPLLRTKQWSGRPHVASVKFYKDMIRKYWRDREFIEHVMYGRVVEGDYDEFRLHIYAPEGTYVRSLHTDGRRRGAESYDPNPS